MLKFGKKITYRPLIISLLLALLPGFILNIIFKPIMGILVGTAIFLIFLLGYYWRNVPTLFNYWEVAQDTIGYSDLSNKKECFKLLLAPLSMHLKIIEFSNIKSVTITGELEKVNDMPMAVPYSGYLAVMTAAISMINNPVNIKFDLKDGTSITVSAARDFIYSEKTTITKLNKMFAELHANHIEVIDHTNHEVKFSY